MDTGVRVGVSLPIAISMGLHILERRTIAVRRVSGRGGGPSGQSVDRDIPLLMNRGGRSRGRDTQIIGLGIDVVVVEAWKPWRTVLWKLRLNRNTYRRIHLG